MGSRRLLLTIVGAITALLGLGAALSGGALLWGHTTQRDAGGFLTSPTYALTSPGYAITSEDVVLEAHPGDWFPADGDLRFRVAVEPRDDASVFVGVAERDALVDYLDTVAHDRVVRLGPGGDDVTLRPVDGGALPRPPLDEALWVASATGPGVQVLEWDARPGTWALAVLNVDGAQDVAVSASVGVHTSLLLPIGLGLLGAGLLALLVGTLVAVAGTVRPAQARTAARVVAATAPDRIHPLRITGRLDPNVSRWKWLVKWALVLPHVVVLSLLWAAFAVLTFVAGVAILVTGRYPRGLFDFNVGVLRWTWRVTFYAFGVLGTDRYPPFSLAPDPDWPADLDVAYPKRLSRGLALVKWWLLVLPHYVIVGLLTTGLFAWTFDTGAPDGFRVAIGGGLIGVLALVSGVTLLVTGRYPPVLFGLVVGLQRWVYRVVAYAALMTDAYPPFRLDEGGDELPVTPAPPDGPPERGGASHELAHH